MRSERRILVFASAGIGIFLALVLVWSIFHAPQEPVYKGQTLTVWVERYVDGSRAYNRRSNPDFLEAEAAIQTIGKDGIPILLSRLREPPDGWKQKLMNLLKKQPVIKPTLREPLVLRREAGKAFSALGAAASNAIPALMQIYRDAKTDETRICCLEAIIGIGPAAAEAAPILLKEATDPTALDFVRFLSINGLRDIRPPPAIVVPAVIPLLRDPDPSMRYNAIELLGSLGADAKPAVPALLQFLRTNTDTNRSLNLQRRAETALGKIDPEAAAQAGIGR